MNRALAVAALCCLLAAPASAAEQSPRPNALEVGAAVATCMSEARGTEVGINSQIGMSTVVTLEENGEVFAVLRLRDADPSQDPTFVLNDPIQPVMALEPLPPGRDWNSTPAAREQARSAFQCFGMEYGRLLGAS